MHTYTLEINDVEYPWSSLYYKRSAPFVEDPIIATIPYTQAITGEHKIEILEDGTVKTTGRVHDFGYVKGKGGVSTKVIGSTLERDAAEIEVFERIINQAPNAFVNNNIVLIGTIKAVPRLTVGTLDAYGSSLPFEFGADWESRWKIRDAWERICQVTGWEIYVSPTGVVDFQNVCGVDRGKTPAISTTKFETGENILNWIKPHREDHTMIAGEVIVIGRKEGVFQAWGNSGAAHPVRKFYFKDLHTPDTCILAAASIDADMGNAIITGRFNHIDEGLTYDVYDIVQIVDKDLGIDTDYRIYAFEKWVSPEKVYGSLVYTNLINMTGNGPLLINRGKGNLVKGQDALKQVTRTPTGLRDEARLFKYNGEDVTGYTQLVGGTGVLTVNKDYCTMQTGVGAGQVILESTDNVMDFANEISLDIRFMINNLVDPVPNREAWLGTWDAVATKGIYFYLDGFDLDAHCFNGPAAGTSIHIEDPIAVDTWYRMSAFKRYAKVYFYLDSVYIGSISTDVPVAGLTTTLYAQQRTVANPGARNYTLYYDQFELHEKNVAAY